MWRFSCLNLFFVVILLTYFIIQRPVSRNWPGETRHLLNDFVVAQSPTPATPLLPNTKSTPSQSLYSPTGYLNNLWNRAMIVRQWKVEYQTSDWDRFRAVGSIETGLVEARFHVASAEAFGLGLGVSREAKIELNRAETCLIATRPLLSNPMLPTVESIQHELEAARTDFALMNTEDSERFERIKNDLDRLIQTVRVARL